jgi:hypothetical protein
MDNKETRFLLSQPLLGQHHKGQYRCYLSRLFQVSLGGFCGFVRYTDSAYSFYCHWLLIFFRAREVACAYQNVGFRVGFRGRERFLMYPQDFFL